MRLALQLPLFLTLLPNTVAAWAEAPRLLTADVPAAGIEQLMVRGG